VLNTLIPQDHPGNLLRLGAPQQFYSWNATVHIDHDRPLGPPNIDEPLVTDPAQAVLVVEIMRGRDPPTSLAIRMQALIEQPCSTRVGSHVPWGEWGADAVIMQAPMFDDQPATFVHGARVMVVWTRVTYRDWLEEYCYEVYTLDFSQRGRSSLPHWCGGDGGPGGGCIKFEPAYGMSSWDTLTSLSDGSLYFLVSCLSQSVGSEAVD